MQIYPILLVGVLLAWDGGLGLLVDGSGLAGWPVAGLAWVPVLLVLGVTWLGVRHYQRRLAAGAGPRAIASADRLVRWARWLLLANHAVVVLAVGWLASVRGVVGDGVLLDEVIAIAPPILGVAGTWWVYYPIERRVRDAVMLRKLDRGRVFFPPPTRGRYVVAQVRLHLLFLLVPILMILGVAELIDLFISPWEGSAWSVWVSDGGTLAAALAIVVAAPLVSRLILDLEPVPRGPLRDDLVEVCRAHGVRVRELLVWNTEGSMVNAAVMGLVGWLRYVLLTDALLESMTRPQLLAVMAHEIGHVRRHHMPWLVISLLASVLAVTTLLVATPLVASGAGAGEAPTWTRLTAAGGALIATLGVFGWVSRRFERQADSFAAVHLSRGRGGGEGGDEPVRVTADAVRTVQSALEAIVRIDADSTRRRSWRHGSIAWRQAYLESIVGRPGSMLPIDRQVRWIKGSAAVLLGLAIAYLTLAPEAG